MLWQESYPIFSVFIIAMFCPSTILSKESMGDLLLNIIVNGQDHNNIQEVVQKDGVFYFTKTQFTDSGLVAKKNPEIETDGLISLNNIEGCSWHLDENAQALFITVPVESQIPQQLNTHNLPPKKNPFQSNTGAVFNYNSEFTHSAGENSNSISAELRLFDKHGVLSNNATKTQNAYIHKTVRLNSTYKISDLGTMRTWNTGDYINSGFAWTRPVRMIGMQMTTNFGLRPDLVTYPRPGIRGEVAVPSSLDIYVNGIHQMSTQAEPGPFEVNQLPVTDGGGEVSMVIKDASGRKNIQNLRFYTSNTLLQKDLESLSFEVGSVRRQYASRSNDYAGGAASASYRRGITSWLTMESHLEASEKVAMGGFGTHLLVDDFGVLSASLAVGGSLQKNGSQYGLSFSRNVHELSYGFSLLKADSRFYDLAAAYGEGTPGTTLRINMGFPIAGKGSLGLVYAQRLVNYYNDYNYESERVQTSTLSATYSTSLPFLSAFGYITLLHDFNYHNNSAVFLGFSMPLGQKTMVSMSTNISGGSSNQSLQANHSAVQKGDVSWNLTEQNGSSSMQSAGLEYESHFGLMGAQFEQGASGQSLRTTLRGAITEIDGHVFATNTIQDSFALVDTNGLSGIEVFQENRSVGKTDKEGLLFIGDLRSYELNHLSINPNDVPMDVSLETDTVDITPKEQSGVLVKFPIHQTRGATLRLVDEHHIPIPLGSMATLINSRLKAMVGYDGMTYFDELVEHSKLKVTIDGRPDCYVNFDYRPKVGSLQEIGPLICISGV